MNQEIRTGQQEGNHEYYDDEISLVDLWIVLMRRKWVILGVMVACVLAGFAFWTTKERQERYVTNIEIGKYINDNNEETRLESREVVETRLRNAIMPSLRNEVADEFEQTLNGLPKVKIMIPDQEGTGDFVFLETIANPDKKEIVEALHQGIVDRLSRTHERMFNTHENRFSIRLSQKKIDLQELKDEDNFNLQKLTAKSELEEVRDSLAEKQETFPIEQQKRKHNLARQKDELEAAKDTFEVKKQNLEHRVRRAEDRIEALAKDRERLEERTDRLSVEEALLTDQEDDIRQWMKNARESQQQLLGSVEENGNIALASLMLGNQAENARKQLTELRRRVSIELPESRAELEAKLEENARREIETRETVAEIETELEKLKKEHERDISERTRNIAQLEETIEKAASDHMRAVEAIERDIERMKAELKQLESDYQRDIDRKKREIELFSTNRDLIEPTAAEAVVVPAETIGRGGKMIVALSLVVGLMIGVFAAFFSEFITQAKRVEQERGK